MKKTVLILVAGLGLVLAGCKDKPKEISTAARAEAAQNASEGEFAIQIRDYPRAEDLFDKATQLDPEIPRYWKELGAARRHRDDNKGARKAYERARELAALEYKRSEKKSISAGFGEVEAYVLLNRPDDARKALERLGKEHPDDPQLKAFVDNKIVDRMLEDTTIKASIVQ